MRYIRKFVTMVLSTAVFLSAAPAMTANAAEIEGTTIVAQNNADAESEVTAITKEEIAQTCSMVQKSAATSRVNSFGYWCYRPYDSKEEALPLVIYLHGNDGRGSKLDRLLSIEGIPQYINNGSIYPNAIVIAPQCPSGSNWTTLASDVMQIIEQVIEEENVDRSRISLTGASLGGIGTFNLAIKYPNFFSAIVPVCGSVNAAKCSTLNDVPVKIYHGTADTGMGFSVKTAAQVISDNGGSCELNMLQGKGHEIRYVYISEEYDILNWMISQQRTDITE